MTGPAPEERSLIERSLRGDLKAFETLVRKHQEMVFRFLLHFAGNASDAEDLTQETFLLVHRKLSQHNPAQSFSSWMISIARNLALSHHRKRIPTPLDPTVLGAAIKTCVPGPENEILMKEAGSQVHLAIQHLPDHLREVVILHYILDRPLEVVAELLNIPEGTAKSRLFKARAEMKEALGKLLFPETAAASAS